MKLLIVGEEFWQSTPPERPSSGHQLPAKVQFVRVGEEPSHCSPPPPISAEFPAILQLTKVGEASLVEYMPPPRVPAELKLIMQFTKLGQEYEQRIPPPFWFAELSLIVQLVKVAQELAQFTPPPPCGPFDRLPVRMQFVKIGEES
jgi:hypothetical protein